MLSLVDIFPERFTAKAGGAEYYGPCPKTGEGHDRFNLKTGDGKERWLCRGGCPDCGREASGASGYRVGDSIDYLREFEGLSFAEACDKLGIPREEKRHDATKKRTTVTRRDTTVTASVTPTVTTVTQRMHSSELKPEELPSAAWMAKARKVMDAAHERLEQSDAGMTYALGRGLTREGIRMFRLGWNDRPAFYDLEEWGLPPEVNPQTGRPRKLFIPAGLMVPTFRRAGCVGIMVRRTDWKPDSDFAKCWEVRGGGKSYFLAGERGLPVVLVEGAIDAMLIRQETGGAVAAVALAGAGKPPSVEVVEYLKAAPLVLLATDNDSAGAKAIAQWKTSFGIRPQVWRVPREKDPGDYLKSGGSLASWAVSGVLHFLPGFWDVPTAKQEPEQVAPPSPEPTEKMMPTGAAYAAFCNGYWEKCFDCEHFIQGHMHFCRRFNLRYGLGED